MDVPRYIYTVNDIWTFPFVFFQHFIAAAAAENKNMGKKSLLIKAL